MLAQDLDNVQGLTGGGSDPGFERRGGHLSGVVRLKCVDKVGRASSIIGTNKSWYSFRRASFVQ
jgi:hypothetical protein